MKLTNEVIAEKVMGWKRSKRWTWMWLSEGGATETVLDYFNDMTAAMMVVEKMYSDGYFCSMDNDHVNNKYDVLFFGKGTDHDAQHELLSHAICTAALKAVGGMK